MRLHALEGESVRLALTQPSHYRVMFEAEIPEQAAHPGLAAAAADAFAGLAARLAVGRGPGAGERR